MKLLVRLDSSSSQAVLCGPAGWFPIGHGDQVGGAVTRSLPGRGTRILNKRFIPSGSIRRVRPNLKKAQSLDSDIRSYGP